MKRTNELERILGQHLGWHKSRVNCLMLMVIAVIKARTVNLAELACAIDGKQSQSSIYRRLQRFISEYEINKNLISRLLWNLLVGKREVYLAMDRTQWQWGKSPINILMINAIIGEVSIPIVWMALNKKGSSNTNERLELIDRFLMLFGYAQVKGLICDREFIGERWLKELKKREIYFYIRVPKSSNMTNRQGKYVDIWTLFLGLKYCESRVLTGTRKIWGIDVKVSGVRCPDGDQLIVVTNAETANNAIEVYRTRWKIESLFQNLKARGFDFEATHITDPARIEKLISVMAIAVAWAYFVGQWCVDTGQAKVKIKKHGRPQTSIFRLGLDLLRRYMLNHESGIARAIVMRPWRSLKTPQLIVLCA